MFITCPKCSAQYKIPSEIKLSDGKKVQCSACNHIFEFHPESEGKNEKISLLPPEDAVLSMTSRTEKITVRTVDTEKSSIPSTPITLPEAFQPVQRQQNTQNPPYFWIVLCGVLLVGLAFIGWMYRDYLLMDNYQIQPNVLSKTRPIRHQRKQKAAPIQSKSPVVTPDIPLSLEEEDIMASTTIPDEPAPIPTAQSALSIQSVRFRKTPTGDAVLIEGVLKNITSETLPVPEKIYALGYDTSGSLAFEKEIYLPSGILYPDMEQPFFGTYTPATKEIQWVDVILQK